MESAKFKKYSILGQVFTWTILFLIHLLENLDYLDDLDAFDYAFCSVAGLAAAAYLHYFKLLPLFNAGKRWIYYLLTFLLITLNSVVAYGWSVYFVFDETYETPFLGSFIYDFFLTTIILGAFSLYYFVEAWYKNVKTESFLRSEKLQAELNFLKSQINPHFLFNTLNNIYAYAQTGNEKTAPMLERLSSILRFMVYDCSVDRVELQKEVDAVEDLLEINKMKNSEQRNITLKVDGVKALHLIAPLIIVNFVENACKHSDAVSNPKGFIHVHILVNEKNQCVLDISNSVKKKTNTPTAYHGVGLENIRKRLELQYGENYQMEESIDADRYHLQLKIPLERKQ